MSKAPKTTVVLACYNGEDFLHKLLFLLSHEPCEVVAVDDNSRDGTWQILDQYDFVRKLRNNQNKGFAVVNNLGGFLADTKYILFLNQDTEPEPRFIKAMEERMEATPECAVVGAKLIFPVSSIRHIVLGERPHVLTRIAGRLDSAGIDLNQQFLPYEVGRNNHPDIPVFNVAKMWPAVTGACMLIKRKAFGELGGFYEDFINGWEDTDLCLRAWELGYQVWYTPEAVVMHYHSTSDARFVNEDANIDLWVKRWFTEERIERLVGKYRKEWEEQ